MNLVTGVFLICIGMHACEDATTQQCSIALGDNVDLPSGEAGNHVLATEEGVLPLTKITAKIKAQIEAEIARVQSEDESVSTVIGHGKTMLGQDYIDQWNKACSK